MTEKQIESVILAWLNLQQDCFAFKVNTVGIFDPVRKIFRRNRNPFVLKGTSDILAVYKGRFIAIEVKTKKGKVSPDQENFLIKVMKNGGYACTVHSLEEAKFFFYNIKNQSTMNNKK